MLTKKKKKRKTLKALTMIVTGIIAPESEVVVYDLITMPHAGVYR
jgi:hypothetical protein